MSARASRQLNISDAAKAQNKALEILLELAHETLGPGTVSIMLRRANGDWRDVRTCSNQPQALTALLNETTDATFARPSVRVFPPEDPLSFYAGVTLQSAPDGQAAVLCLVDSQPRDLTPANLDAYKAALSELAVLARATLRNRAGVGVMTRLAAAIDNQSRTIAQQEKALAHSRKIFERSSAAAKIGVWECNLADESLTWTDSVYDLFEIPRGVVITRAQILELYERESLEELERRRKRAIEQRSGFTLDAQITTAKGARRWMRLTASVECEGDTPVRIFGMKQDITEEKTLSERTRFLAEYDVLTGLANRSLFQSGLAALTAAHPTHPGASALLLVDLDGFKQVNDSFGHALGDQCLKEIATRLKSLCREGDLVARIGGDEFAILMRPPIERSAVGDLAKRIVAGLRRPVHWCGQSFQLGASVGIAIAELETPASSSDIFTNADTALYAAKAGGRNTFRVFTPSMKSESDRRLRTVRDIAQALSAGELALHYQPKVSLKDFRVVGFEALLRRRLPDGRFLTAGAFEAAFEDPELSRQIGTWVLDEALGQAARWSREGLDFGHIAINLSSSQLRDGAMATKLISRLRALELRPEKVEIEITEGVFLQNEAGPIRDAVTLLKASGVRIALDDFGTGYASLVHLRSYPVDTIKIDRSFVTGVLASPQDGAILKAMLQLGADLGLNVVAEGVETVEQMKLLKALGCPCAQGFLFAKALTAADAERLCAVDVYLENVA